MQHTNSKPADVRILEAKLSAAEVERNDLKFLLSDLNSRVFPGISDSVDSLRTMYREHKAQAKAIEVLTQALESIVDEQSDIRSVRATIAETWMRFSHALCAETIAKDTEIAREALAEAQKILKRGRL